MQELHHPDTQEARPRTTGAQVQVPRGAQVHSTAEVHPQDSRITTGHLRTTEVHSHQVHITGARPAPQAAAIQEEVLEAVLQAAEAEVHHQEEADRATDSIIIRHT